MKSPPAKTTGGAGQAPAAPREVTIIEPQREAYLPDLQELWGFRNLYRSLVWRNFKVRYRNATLGAFWVILQPLLVMTIFTLVFGRLAALQVKGIPYSLLLLSGLILLFFMNRVISESMNIIRTEANLTRKVYFPKLLLPLAVVTSAAVDLVVMAALLLAMMLARGIWPEPQAFMALGYLLLLLGLGIAFSVALAALGIRFMDLLLFMPLVTLLLTYLSPIIYPITFVPEHLLHYYALNPMVGIVNGFRWALFGIEPFYPWMGLQSLAVILVLGLAGLVYFVRTERDFNDLL